jgi:hypothetical protein
MNLRRRRLQRQIVLLMAMRAAHRVKMLPHNLLLRKLGLPMTASENQGQRCG